MTHPWCFFMMTMVTLQVGIIYYIECGMNIILDLLKGEFIKYLS